MRQQLEAKLGCDLTARKKEIDGLVMDYVNNSQKSSDEDGSESSEDEKSRSKRSSAKKSTNKRKNDDDSGSDQSEEDYKPQKTAPKGKKAKKADSSASGSDNEWKKPKKAKKAAGAGAGKGKSTGFTRPYTLSPDLAAIMGTESSPRHEVVKKVWSIIKERNLYDPKNKQYAICDSELIKVIGVKRFRTFGMLKYLKSHFID